MVERRIVRLQESPEANGRYEVQFQKDAQRHSTTNDLDQARSYALALANWNLAAQVFDRVTQSIVFRAQAYRDRKETLSKSEDEHFQFWEP